MWSVLLSLALALPAVPGLRIVRTAAPLDSAQSVTVTITPATAPSGQQNVAVLTQLWVDGVWVAGDSLALTTPTVVWATRVPAAKPNGLSTARFRVRTITTTSKSAWAVVETRRKGVSAQGDQPRSVTLLPGWTNVRGTVTGTVNGLRGNVGGLNVAQRGTDLWTSLSDQWAEVTLHSRTANDDDVGVVVRMLSGAPSGYVAYISSETLPLDSARVYLAQLDNGSLITRATQVVRWTAGSVLRIEARGSVITGYFNSQQVGTFTSTTYPIGISGVYFWGTTTRARTWSAGALESLVPTRISATVPSAALGGSDSVRVYLRAFADSARVPVSADLLVGTVRTGSYQFTVPMRRGWRYAVYAEPYAFNAPMQKFHLGKMQLER
jgi:hypothetical protein